MSVSRFQNHRGIVFDMILEGQWCVFPSHIRTVSISRFSSDVNLPFFVVSFFLSLNIKPQFTVDNPNQRRNIRKERPSSRVGWRRQMGR